MSEKTGRPIRNRIRMRNFTQKGHPAIRILKLNHDERNRERREKNVCETGRSPENHSGTH